MGGAGGGAGRADHAGCRAAGGRRDAAGAAAAACREGLPGPWGKTGDPASARDRMQLRTQVAALALARDHELPVPRMIAADLSGSQAGVLALVTSVLPGGRARCPGRCPPGGHASWARRRTSDSCCRADAPAGPAAADPAAGGHGLCRLAPLSWYHAAAGQGGTAGQRAAGAWRRGGAGARGPVAGQHALVRRRVHRGGRLGRRGRRNSRASTWARCGWTRPCSLAGRRRPDPRWLAASRGPGAGARRVLGHCRRPHHGRRHGAVHAAAARPPPAGTRPDPRAAARRVSARRAEASSTPDAGCAR